MKVLLTGANGFVGLRIAQLLQSSPRISLTAAVRTQVDIPGAQIIQIENFDTHVDWLAALKDQNVVIHTAARAHILESNAMASLPAYRSINVDSTINLAKQAAEAGVKRFIFISSIKVNGEKTNPGHPFKAEDIPQPEDAYAVSKWEAEQGLEQLASATEMQIVIIRPPLVYGPRMKGNFAWLSKLISKGVPLPLGLIKNKRSFVYLDNLVDLIITCIDHPGATNQTFLVSDDYDLSTTELVEAIKFAMGKRTVLLPIPSEVINFCANLCGRRALSQRLLGNLQVDMTKTKIILGWQPPFSAEEGLVECYRSIGTSEDRK
jgi:nucleoside-diphosphate-sugar epimerase